MTDTQKKRALKTFWIVFSIPIVFMIVLFTIISVGGKDLPREHLRYMPDFKELENLEMVEVSFVYVTRLTIHTCKHTCTLDTLNTLNIQYIHHSTQIHSQNCA